MNTPTNSEAMPRTNCSSLVLSPCWCGGKAKGEGRTIECSSRKCGSLVIRKTRNESIARWNEIMKPNSDNPKPETVEQHAGEGLDETPYPRLIFQRRWYDSQWKRLTDWADVEGRDLFKYGETPEEWISMPKSYIEMGATYEYRIIERTDKITWSVSYSANASRLASADPETPNT